MKKPFLLQLLFAIIAFASFGQTATGTFTQIPCNNDGIYTVTTSGFSLPITYTYWIGGNQIVHANVNSTTDQLMNIPMDDNYSIFIEVTDGTLSDYVSDSYVPNFSFTTSAVSPVCPATTGSLTATHTGGAPGPFSFEWTNAQSLAVYQGNNVSVPEGVYEVTITDQTTGCVLELDTGAVVQQVSNVSATMSSTEASCTNGTATAVGTGGVAPYSYLWMNGATGSTISGLSQNYYTVVVTDAQGCQSNTLGVNVQQNPTISVNVTATDATCQESDGSAIAFGSGGTPPYTYEWSNGYIGNEATNLTGFNFYNVLVTDANGCSGTGMGYVGSDTPINVTYLTTPSDCTTPTGSVTLNPIGGTTPYTVVWNTNPGSSNLSLLNVSPGSYSFTVTDSVGCTRTGTAVVQPSSSMYVSIPSASIVCPSTTGSLVANVSGTNPPFTYLWDNAATSNQIVGVPSGSYTCTVTDALGCSVTKSGTLSNSSSLNMVVSTTPVTCEYNTDGAASTMVFGGTPPYSYTYSNGSTTSGVNGLGLGNHFVTVTDANGCSKTKEFTITNANTSDDCYCVIEGTVFVDDNSNCTIDGGEAGIENIMVHCSGFGYVFTDANGHYSFNVPSGTYTITEQINNYYPLATCQVNGVAVNVTASSGCSTTVNFANDMNIVNDLKLTMFNSTIPPVPGNPYQQKVIVENLGTVTELDVQLEYELDPQLYYSNSTNPGFGQLGGPNSYGVQSGFPVLAPNENEVMLLNYNTPTNIPIGSELSFDGIVAHLAPIDVNWLLDASPWNNVNQFETVVIGSYDPNYKEVSPKGIGPEGYISSNTTEFDYTIHFQNEGTYYAQNIYITDQLDDDLDWTTLRPGYSDYDYTTTISETGLVTFTFENINLPWKSSFGDALSSGLINYSIERKPGVPQGTVFTNTANIYFDYNAPITTNTTINTLNDGMFANVEEQFLTSEDDPITLEAYPVPADDHIVLRVNNVPFKEKAVMNVVGLMGNTVISKDIELEEGSTAIYQNLSSLLSGSYFVQVQLGSGAVVVKNIIVL